MWLCPKLFLTCMYACRHPSTRSSLGSIDVLAPFLCQAITSTNVMMTSSNGNIFRVTGHLCGEFTGPRWIPRTKASDTELWCFLWNYVWINGWVNNREAGDLRRYRAHYDVTVMVIAVIVGDAASCEASKAWPWRTCRLVKVMFNPQIKSI